MTTELKQYIDSLSVQVYRMIDGSILISEENHRDSVDGYVILQRPLQICQMVVDNELKQIYIPWIPGETKQVKIKIESIIAETDASFEQKFAYSRYYLITHLQKYLSPTEYQEVIASTQTALSESSTNSKKPNDWGKLQNTLSKNKHFELN